MTAYVVIEETVVYAVTTETSVDVVVQPLTTQLTVQPGAPPLTVQEIDGVPSVSNVVILRVPNGSLTDDGNGQVTFTGGGDAYYRHVQGVAAAIWTVVHNLGKFPNVRVVDSAGDTWLVAPHDIDTNQLTLTFPAPFSGEAYCS
jgi:hypothetical protein